MDGLQLNNIKYKPSAWSPGLTPDRAIEKLLKIGAECKLFNQSNISHQLEIPYGERPGMTYDIYGTDLAENAPIFIFIHGGFWQMMTKNDNTFLVHPLVQAGYRVYLIGYDLCPTVTLEELYEEIEVGMKKVLKEAEKNKCPEVRIAGHSAGACLAMAMLSQEWIGGAMNNLRLIKAVYLIAGIYDLTAVQFDPEVNDGNILGLTEDSVRKLSPLLDDFIHLKDSEVKIFHLIAENDATGFIYQGTKMFAKLAAQGVNTELVLADDYDHFEMVTNLRDADCYLTKLMIKKVE